MHQIVTKDPPRLKKFSELLCNFIERCLQKNPDNRWDAERLLDHTFIKKNADKGK